MFTLSSTPLHVDTLRKEVNSSLGVGAFVFFEGRVRHHNHGKEVLALEYEAYETLALKEGKRILEEVKRECSILGARAAHRTGYLKPGDLALCVIVTAEHRKAAFIACNRIIDRIKEQLPIWKKEHYREKACWISCHSCRIVDETLYYERQKNLNCLGEQGQSRLKKARVLVVGAGGLGCPALSYLTAAGVGHIGICDHDRLEVSNLHRQVLYSQQDLGELKAVLARDKLSQQNPFVRFSIYPYRLDEGNVEKVITNYDLILDCSDNIETKFLLHDASFLQKIPLVQASIYQFEGQMHCFKHDRKSGCLRCLFPKMPSQVDSCADVGVLGVVPGILGTWQAAEAIKMILGESVEEKMVLFDLLSSTISKIASPPNEDCPLCGKNPSLDRVVSTSPPLELHLLPAQLKDYTLLDIREAQERNPMGSLEKIMRHFPTKDIHSFSLFSKKEKLLLICQKGRRSRELTRALREAGYSNAFSLAGGIVALKLAFV